MSSELTNDELVQLGILLDTLKVDMGVDQPVWRSKPLLRVGAKQLPLEHEAASESFLVAEMEGRVRLSTETRLMEEKRLAKRGKKRKPYKLRKGSHWKSKAATARRRQRKAWAEDPLARVRHSFRQGVDITAEEWQRLIEPVWQAFPTESLRLRSTGGGRLHVYNLLLVHTPKGRGATPLVVYDGPNQAVWDSMDGRYSERVQELGRAGKK